MDTIAYNGCRGKPHMLFIKKKEYSEVKHGYIVYRVVTLRYNGYMRNLRMLFTEKKEYSKVKHVYIGHSLLTV